MASLSDLQQENNVTSSEEHGYENPWPKEDRNVKPSSPQPTARFLVEQVKNEPKDRMELSDSDSGAHSRVLSDSSRHSITDGTIGYATNEAVPMTIFYRNEYSQSHEKKYRPTLQELQKGFGEVPEQQGESTDANQMGGVENGEYQGGNSLKVYTHGEKVKVAPKFGWIKGVMLRCLLNIWGVMLFLRLTWVVGQSGIGWSTVIVLLSALVTVLTTLSMSAVCTNGEVKGGGAYFLISRSLGPEFGGSIGLIFSLANAVAVALYVVGFAETVRDILRDNDSLMVDEVNDIRIVGILTVLLLLGVTLVGLEWVVRTQMFLLGILLISIIDVMVGTFLGPQNEVSKARGFMGYKMSIFESNFGTHYRDGENFFSVFAVFFPAATGILAGVNISGDLRDAQKAIPKGTMLAILLSTIVYVVLGWFAGACVLRDAHGIVAAVDAVNGTVSMNGTSLVLPSCPGPKCVFGLMNDFQVMEKISAWGPLVTAGIFAATLSSALASLVGAPKTFQALCKDDIFPYIEYFGVGRGPGEEPRRGYLLTFVIAAAFIAIGELNIIAPVISNFFLMSYALINYAVFAASLARSPGWRPSFKYYNMWVSLVGALLCVAIMFLINWWAALVTIVIVTALYKYVDIKKPDVNWGSSAQAYTYIRALRFTYRLNTVEDHVKNFRPQCLVLTGPPSSRPNLTYIVSQITRNVGLMVCGQVNVGSFTRTSSYEDGWLKERKIRAFHTICTAPALRAGVQAMLQSTGVGKLKPNTLVLGFKRNWKRVSDAEITEYVNIINDAFEMNYGVAILRMRDEYQIQEDVYDGDDWMGDGEEENFVPKSHSPSGSKDSFSARPTSQGSGVYSERSQSTSGGKFFQVERAMTPESVGLLDEAMGIDPVEKSDDTDIKSKEYTEGRKKFVVTENVDLYSDKNDSERGLSHRETSSVSGSAAPASELDYPGGSTRVEVGSLTKGAQSVKTSDFSVSQTLTLDSEKAKDIASQKSGTTFNELSDGTSHFQPRPTKTEELVSSPISFRGKQRGTIDVWWLSDDGGLTILIPYIISLNNSWKDCKLRIFTPASTRIIKNNEVRMANLLKKFRIDFSSIEEVHGIDKPPSRKAIEEFLKLPIQGEFGEEGIHLDKRMLRQIRTGELLRQHSKDARLIVMTLPVPKLGMMSARLYMSWLEVLSADLPPVLLVRGNQTSVLTFYC